MYGKKLIKTINKELLDEITGDYRKMILKERVKKTLFTIGKISGQVILVAGVLGGAMFLAAAAPNVVGAVGRVAGGRKKKPLYFHCNEKKFSRSLSYLKNQHLIEIINEDGRTSLRLTKRGQRRYRIHLIEHMTIEKQKKWDGWWRIVIFDIPERFKNARDALRQRFQSMGFFQIQKSVFAIPYPCDKEINFIRHLFGLEEQIRIIRANYFQGESMAKEFFKLD